MAAPPSAPTPPKSRGHTLFDRQAQLHADSTGTPLPSLSTAYFDQPNLPPKLHQPLASAPIIYRHPANQNHSPLLVRGRSPLSTSERLSYSNDNVQLIGIHPRPESTYVKEWPSPPRTLTADKPQETDFPLVELRSSGSTLPPSDSLCCAVVEQAFDYLQTHDDNDDIVYKKSSMLPADGSDNDENSEGTDSVDIIDLDTTSSTQQPTDSGVHTFSSRDNADKRHDSEEKLAEQQSPMASSSRGTGSEDNDSDSDNQSRDDDLDNDDELLAGRTPAEELINEEEERQKQLIIRQQKILWSIAQEWLRKEKSYVEQLEKLDQQLSPISLAVGLIDMIKQLIDYHKNVCKEIELLYERDHQLGNLTIQLTRAIEPLMSTLNLYNDYIKKNLAPIRKALDKRSMTNGMSSEDLLSIPTKQFLQIISQVQDLHRTALSFNSQDRTSLAKLTSYAQRCKTFGSPQDENINKTILKNEDVVMPLTRGSRDRCRLVLYPDAIVCCYLKTKLLASPKYALHWFIPMISLQCTVPQSASDDIKSTGDDLKSNLKSSYKELEKAPKSNVISSRLTKAIRKQENEYNLSQSKLQLILTNTSSPASSSRSSNSPVILFSSAYQRQEWIDSIERTRQELFQRTANLAVTSDTNHQRLNESLIQKRLDLIKPHVQEPNTSDPLSSSKPSKTYSGTLNITIHSIHGTALYNPVRQQQALPLLAAPLENNYQFFVAVEIDSYNTFFPYAQTAKRSMQQQESVEFKGEVFEVELEYSLAFRLLIYRIDTTSTSGNPTVNSQRAQCVGKFHRNIETALHDSNRSPNGILNIESPSGDLKLRISLKYSEREGTFKRRKSKRSQAVFGKSIETLLSTSDGCIDGIPRLIAKCIDMVDRDGLKETGIYRVCCVTSDLQKLRHQFDRHYLRGEEMLAEKNVHVAANLLKLFLRELPEPLFTSALYTQFTDAIQLKDADNQRVTLLKTLELLPSANRKILFHLLDHLIRVSQYSDVNMMHLDNLAVVFGPTLMRPSKLMMINRFSGSNTRLNVAGATDLDHMSMELQGSMQQCEVVLACLKLRRDERLK